MLDQRFTSPVTYFRARNWTMRHLRDWLSRSRVRHCAQPDICTARGATATEYLVILVLASVGLIAGIELFAGGLGHQLDNAAELLAGTSTDGVQESGQGVGSGAGDAATSGASEASDSSYSGRDDSGSDRVGGARATSDHGAISGSAASDDEDSGGLGPLLLIALIIGGVVFGALKFSDN